MSPDFVWLKSRSQGFPHWLFDTIRGTEKELRTDSNAAEGTNANTLTSFNSDGFTLGSNVIINNSGQSMVGWAWDAGDSTTTIAAGANGTNLPGTACQVRANPSAGFSIVKVDECCLNALTNYLIIG